MNTKTTRRRLPVLLYIPNIIGLENSHSQCFFFFVVVVAIFVLYDKQINYKSIETKN